MLSLSSFLSFSAFLIFVQELALLLFFVVRGTGDAESEDGVVPGSESSAATTPLRHLKVIDGEDRLDDDIRFLFDVVARQNEGLVKNIDAADNGLVAIAVGIVAIALFAADKWFELDPSCRIAGLFFLVESVVCIALGHVTVRLAGAKVEYVAQLDDFAVDFAESPGESTSSAILNITRSAKINVVVRRLKRTFMMLATLLAVVAAGIIVVGRVVGNVSNH